jgi:RimJ/RimL family protein N-acetyltransferase
MGPQTLRDAPRLLHTPRLTLEAPRAEHAEAFAAVLNASLDGWRFIGWGQVARDLAWAEEFCRRGAQFVDDGEDLIFNVFDNAGGGCVGRIDLHSFDFDAPRCEIGYVGDPRRSGQGLMREAVLAVVALGFELGLARIEAFSDVRNQRAIRFARGLGFRTEGVVRSRERDPQGALCDQVLMAQLRPTGLPPAGEAG